MSPEGNLSVSARDERLHEGDRPPDQREEGQRDRDRVLYSSAFRRLAGVTQVVGAHEGHVFHNRLTHSLEVAQVARRLAEKLAREQSDKARDLGGINPDVVEAAALAHDLGHPPFGHIVENELNDLLHDCGGYEGNAQSFRIVTKLSLRAVNFPGLNLTRATLDAILKYPWLREDAPTGSKKWNVYESEKDEFAWVRRERATGDMRKSAEAEIMDWADDIAYSVHDVEDFFRAGLIPLDRLGRTGETRERRDFYNGAFERLARENVALPADRTTLEKAFEPVLDMLPVDEPYGGNSDQRVALRTLTASLIGRFVKAISLHVPATLKEDCVEIDGGKVQEVFMLKQLTWHYVINNPSLAAQQHGQVHLIRTLFNEFVRAAEKGQISVFPVGAREALATAKSGCDFRRVVADLIAGMTEHQAFEMFHRLTGISPGSFLIEIIR